MKQNSKIKHINDYTDYLVDFLNSASNNSNSNVNNYPTSKPFNINNLKMIGNTNYNNNFKEIKTDLSIPLILEDNLNTKRTNKTNIIKKDDYILASLIKEIPEISHVKKEIKDNNISININISNKIYNGKEESGKIKENSREFNNTTYSSYNSNLKNTYNNKPFDFSNKHDKFNNSLIPNSLMNFKNTNKFDYPKIDSLIKDELCKHNSTASIFNDEKKNFLIPNINNNRILHSNDPNNKLKRVSTYDKNNLKNKTLSTFNNQYNIRYLNFIPIVDELSFKIQTPIDRGYYYKIVSYEFSLIKNTLESNGFKDLSHNNASKRNISNNNINNNSFTDSSSIKERSSSVDSFNNTKTSNLNFNTFNYSLVSIFWTGNLLKSNQLSLLTKHQRINHYPKSYELTRKDCLYKNLCILAEKVHVSIIKQNNIIINNNNNIISNYYYIKNNNNNSSSDRNKNNISIMSEKNFKFKCFIKDFNFIPISYLLPKENRELEIHMGKNSQEFWIIKPVASSQGRGIFITNKFNEIPFNKGSYIASKYIDNPFLLNKKKFDLRIYVLITSIDPLRIYIYKEGLVRFASEDYDGTSINIKNKFKHLTNYAVNKDNESFKSNCDLSKENEGNKWSLDGLKKELESRVS